MENKTTRFEKNATWLGYLGILPFILGFILLFSADYAALALSGILNYAAIILTFVGAIHWGRALSTCNPRLLNVSIIPSLVAWCALFMSPEYAIPLLIVGFVLLFAFDYRQYLKFPWFQRLRMRLTVSVCGLMALSWLTTL